jgi:hypothetical protein
MRTLKVSAPECERLSFGDKFPVFKEDLLDKDKRTILVLLDAHTKRPPESLHLLICPRHQQSTSVRHIIIGPSRTGQHFHGKHIRLLPLM